MLRPNEQCGSNHNAVTIICYCIVDTPTLFCFYELQCINITAFQAYVVLKWIKIQYNIYHLCDILYMCIVHHHSRMIYLWKVLGGSCKQLQYKIFALDSGIRFSTYLLSLRAVLFLYDLKPTFLQPTRVTSDRIRWHRKPFYCSHILLVYMKCTRKINHPRLSTMSQTIKLRN